MAIVKLHFDGWLALPAAVRSRLDLRTGDTFSVEVMDDKIVLQLRADEVEVEDQPEVKAQPEPKPVAKAEPKAAEPKPMKAAATTPAPEPEPAPVRRRVVKKATEAPTSAPSMFPLKTRAVGGRKKSAPTA